MKAIILAAGYGTRLYPITRNLPKCFLKYKEKMIIDYLLDELEKLFFSEIIIVTNGLFYNQFLDYKKRNLKTFTLISDGSLSNETRLGAGNDIIFTIDKCKIKESCFIIACDNIFNFSFKDFIFFYEENKISSLMYYEEIDLEKLKKTGVIEIDEDNNVLSFIEKPEKYLSNFAVPPVYILNEVIIKDLI